ncbi:MAG TPA: thiolase family protein [Thermoleophilaceae bacterium]|nr:thiolase family protein [Thermoleophilaceae bacterium]
MSGLEPRDAVIVAAVRTPMGRYGGQLSSVRPDDLAAIAVGEAVRRAGVGPEEVDDVILGCANQAGEDNRNVARMAALLAGFPVEVPGQTVNRLCGSGMQALIAGAREIRDGAANVIVAGGVESMSRSPFVMMKPEVALARGAQTLEDTALGWRLVNPKMVELGHTDSLGETAEKVAERYGVTRQEQDAFALRSHRLALAAQASGLFDEEIVPVEVEGRKGALTVVDADEGPRPDAELERLPELRAVFRTDGTVTAGNASPLNDGAAALVLMSGEEAQRRGLVGMARFVDGAYAGVDPSYMGIGPVPATRKLLERRGLSVADVDLAEVNEAFAAQAVPSVRELGLDLDVVNVNGGAIALGHPLGASGARMVGALVRELGRRGGRYGLATMCIGVGQGIASLWERT